MLNSGTPKTLAEAIDNGVKAFSFSENQQKSMGDFIEEHIKDYLAQKFGAALLTAALIADSNDTETLIANLAKDCGLKVNNG